MKYLIFFACLFGLLSSSALAGMVENNPLQKRAILPTTTIPGTFASQTATSSSSSVITTSSSSSGSPTSTLGDPPPGTTVNPIIIPVPSGRGISLQGTTNAVFTQRVTVSLSGGSNASAIVFQGAGEGNPQMKTLPSPGQICATFGVQGSKTNVILLFENIDDGKISNSLLQIPSGTNILNFRTEDAGDNDFDDCLFTLAFLPGGNITC